MLNALDNISLKIRKIKEDTQDVEKLAELIILIKEFNEINSQKGLNESYPTSIIEEAEQLLSQARETKKLKTCEVEPIEWITDSFYCEKCNSIEQSGFLATESLRSAEKGFNSGSFKITRTRICQNCGFAYRTQETLISDSDKKTRTAKQAVHLNYDIINNLESAKGFIRKCVYWINHSSGGDVLCPRFSEKVYQGSSGYEIEFGANKLLITVLFKRVIDELNSVFSGKTCELSDDWIDLIIRGAVANYKGIEYPTYYPVTDTWYLKFGNHGVDIDDARRFILRHPKLREFFKAEEYKTALYHGSNL